LLLERTLAIIFLDRIPHVNWHKRFVADKAGNILPGIAILKCKIIDFSIKFCRDFFVLELKMDSINRIIVMGNIPTYLDNIFSCHRQNRIHVGVFLESDCTISIRPLASYSSE
jgi:hypothetical protein